MRFFSLIPVSRFHKWRKKIPQKRVRKKNQLRKGGKWLKEFFSGGCGLRFKEDEIED